MRITSCIENNVQEKSLEKKGVDFVYFYLPFSILTDCVVLFLSVYYKFNFSH